MDTHSVNLSDIVKFSFVEWKQKSKPLNKENAEEIMSFYVREYNTYLPPYYHCLPSYNTDNSHKYFVVSINGDKVFFCFKIIQIMNTKKIKVYDKPISLNGKKENEDLVFNALKQIDFCIFLSKECYSQEGNESIQDFDYFLDKQSQIEKYTNKYLKKKLVYRYLTNDFKVSISNENCCNEAFALRAFWEKEKIIYNWTKTK